jgi:hypothetical protein
VLVTWTGGFDSPQLGVWLRHTPSAVTQAHPAEQAHAGEHHCDVRLRHEVPPCLFIELHRLLERREHLRGKTSAQRDWLDRTAESASAWVRGTQ